MFAPCSQNVPNKGEIEEVRAWEIEVGIRGRLGELFSARSAGKFVGLFPIIHDFRCVFTLPKCFGRQKTLKNIKFGVPRTKLQFPASLQFAGPRTQSQFPASLRFSESHETNYNFPQAFSFQNPAS